MLLGVAPKNMTSFLDHWHCHEGVLVEDSGTLSWYPPKQLDMDLNKFVEAFSESWENRVDSHVRYHGRHPHDNGEKFEELQTFFERRCTVFFWCPTRCRRNTNMSSTYRREPSPRKVPVFS